MTTDQISALSTADVAALTTAQIVSLSTSDLAALTTNDVAGLTTKQLNALTTAQIALGLTTDQIAALTTSGIAALRTSQMAALNTDDVVALTTSQAEALTTAQLMALSSTQIQAFTTTQVSYLAGFSSPLVLDLTGNGITTQNISAGAQFDLNATGQAVQTGWVTSGEGLLVYDPSNGPITSGSQLFGTATVLPNGQKAANGFAALAALDTNHDGIITSADTGWSNLKVWVGETASNGVVQGGQLETLDSLGIVQINLSYTSDPTMNNGNIVGMVSSFVTSNGQTHQMADVWFQTSPLQSTKVTAPTTAAATSLASTLTTSQVTSLTTGGQVAALATAPIASLTASQIASLTPQQVSALFTTAGLQSQVGGLVQAMGSFNQSQSVTAGSSGLAPVNTQSNVNSGSDTPGVAVNVTVMVRALQQFDPHHIQSVPTPIVNNLPKAALQEGAAIVLPPH